VDDLCELNDNRYYIVGYDDDDRAILINGKFLQTASEESSRKRLSTRTVRPSGLAKTRSGKFGD
jgi:hypothetical protein